jgi:hypothetical protein
MGAPLDHEAYCDLVLDLLLEATKSGQLVDAFGLPEPLVAVPLLR